MHSLRIGNGSIGPQSHVRDAGYSATWQDDVDRLNERIGLKLLIEIPLYFTLPIELRAEIPMRKSSEPQNEMLKTRAQASK